VDLLYRNFGFYHVQLYLMIPDGNALVAGHGSGERGKLLRQDGYSLPVGTGIVGHVAEIGEPFTTNAVDQVLFYVRNPLLPDTQAEMAIPIKIEGKVLGVLDIQQTSLNILTDRQMQLMVAVSDQLAVALQKANLYTELQNSLRHEKAIRSQLVQSERLALVGRLLASVSHELNNPIQAIQNALFLLKEEESFSDQGRQDLEIVISETERMAALIDRLRATYRPTHSEDYQDVQLNEVVEYVHALTATHMRHSDIRFEFQPNPDLPPVSGIPEQLRQVILNLFMNAIEATRSGGRLAIKSEYQPEQNKVLLTFKDTGSGIDPQLLPHIFEPFITDKDKGTGLGLTISYDIIQQHHGEIQAENDPQGGAIFKIWLPVKDKG
jgi:two-component system NtrC family sensor kinase